MKKLLLFVSISFVLFISCNKTAVTPENIVNATTQDEASAAASPVKTRSAILTSHPWMYQGYYFHYVDKHNKGEAEYERGAANNDIDLDQTRFTFRSNGTFVEIDGGYRYPGTWNFTDNTATVLILNFSWGDDDCTIVNMNANHLSYTQPLGYHDLSYTELVTAQ